ncbi:MAG: lysine--tRNA ligase [Candidatus Huberarchaeum crystalense]|uniref:Lysine--tRNA ligase n=1 Tax=Huberarchaeum crystalense TaxID=2014257 RepID=A0A2G9LIY9_HUBC1|nr:lysine--tRNA ligase [archaeon]OIP20196.1 MAG: lysine--tRNA ligase [archaeon CG2_30_31_98]PIN66484.1 MAG: lysine--tRNA ligase [Candidatus Huberarchaeum crystalense]NCS98136.1 lysine--tRNA ligase [archaeon]PIV13843.1 MAG: lysine--tRNA ligase [Candidatus Huberarchaeum crystalense]
MANSLEEPLFWADNLARRIINKRPNKLFYTIEAGITPSGNMHIGTLREVMICSFVERALLDLGKSVRFLFIWDDYDRLRKLPSDLLNREEMQKYLYFPVSKVFDLWGCHSSWAEHFEKPFEDQLKIIGISPKYIYQSVEYTKGTYAEECLRVLGNKQTITEILNKIKTNKTAAEDFLPIQIYCEKCSKDTTQIIENQGINYKYSCSSCGFEGAVNILKDFHYKLGWRVDWPMRWKFYDVDFESSGSDHSVAGGSFDTGKEIINQVWAREPPLHQHYGFIIGREGGKLSKSVGGNISPGDLFEVFSPSIVRFLFARARPETEYSIVIDDESYLKTFADFFKHEDIYFNSNNIRQGISEKNIKQFCRIYEMSVVGTPSVIKPVQPDIRNLVFLMNFFQTPQKALAYLKKNHKIKLSVNDEELYLQYMTCCQNWLKKYAPSKYKYKLRQGVDQEIKKQILPFEIEIIKQIIKLLNQPKVSDELIKTKLEQITTADALDKKAFYAKIYQILFRKDEGPNFAGFCQYIGKTKIVKILKEYIKKESETDNKIIEEHKDNIKKEKAKRRINKPEKEKSA